MPKYYIAGASRDHVQRGVQGGFMQVNHGKKPKLVKLKTGDWVFYYSSKISMSDPQPTCQKFTAIGQIKDEELYQGIMSDDFQPWRRNVEFVKNIHEIEIKPLINQLHFIKDPKRWGYPLMYGFLEIDEIDGELLRSLMISFARG
jgi:predicted RNA-binding protein